eukprot:403364197
MRQVEQQFQTISDKQANLSKVTLQFFTCLYFGNQSTQKSEVLKYLQEIQGSQQLCQFIQESELQEFNTLDLSKLWKTFLNSFKKLQIDVYKIHDSKYTRLLQSFTSPLNEPKSEVLIFGRRRNQDIKVEELSQQTIQLPSNVLDDKQFKISLMKGNDLKKDYHVIYKCLGNTNPSFYKLNKQKPFQLQKGDVLNLGQQVFIQIENCDHRDNKEKMPCIQIMLLVHENSQKRARFGDKSKPIKIGCQQATVDFHISKDYFPQNDFKISRNHCEIFQDLQGFWCVRDLNSKNGTYLSCQTNQVYQIRHELYQQELQKIRQAEQQKYIRSLQKKSVKIVKNLTNTLDVKDLQKSHSTGQTLTKAITTIDQQIKNQSELNKNNSSQNSEAVQSSLLKLDSNIQIKPKRGKDFAIKDQDFSDLIPALPINIQKPNLSQEPPVSSNSVQDQRVQSFQEGRSIQIQDTEAMDQNLTNVAQDLTKNTSNINKPQFIDEQLLNPRMNNKQENQSKTLNSQSSLLSNLSQEISDSEREVLIDRKMKFIMGDLKIIISIQ